VNWQDHLAEEAKRRNERKASAAKQSEQRRQVQARHVQSLFPQLADAFNQAAAIYNQAGGQAVQVDGPRRDKTGETLDLTIEKKGYRFADSGKGFVRVFEIEPEREGEHAFVQPLVNKAGDLVGWQEKQVFSGGKTLGRTVDTLTEAYLMAIVRRRLLA
jgi:hypothetical protein